MIKVDILVFDTGFWGEEVTLDCPEIRRTPPAVAQMVRAHVLENEYSVIRTYSDIPINLLGMMTADGEVKPGEARIWLPDGSVHEYDKEGVLTSWKYGLFNFTDG